SLGQIHEGRNMETAWADDPAPDAWIVVGNLSGYCQSGRLKGNSIRHHLIVDQVHCNLRQGAHVNFGRDRQATQPDSRGDPTLFAKEVGHVYGRSVELTALHGHRLPDRTGPVGRPEERAT